MKAIPIAKVRALSEAAGGRGAILLVFDGEGNYSGASYGDTRPECRELGRLLDEICDGLGRVGVGALHTPRIGSTRAGRRAEWVALRAAVEPAPLPAGQCGRALAGGWLCVRAVDHVGDCRRELLSLCEAAGGAERLRIRRESAADESPAGDLAARRADASEHEQLERLRANARRALLTPDKG